MDEGADAMSASAARKARRAAKTHEAPAAVLKPPQTHEPCLDEAAPGSLIGEQRICLSAIIRESDAAMVSRCLRSCRPFLTEWAVIDTGSTEEVKNTIRRELAALPGQLVEREWPDDFSIARNWALDLAKQGDAESALFIDADDWIEPAFLVRGASGLVLPILPRPEMAAAHFPSLSSGGGIYYRTTFATLTPDLRWTGAVHERLNVPDSAFITSYCIRVGASDRKDKRYPYFQVLRAEVEKDPEDINAWWHLARHCMQFYDHEEAIRCADRVLSLLETTDARLLGSNDSRGLRYCILILRARGAAALGLPTNAILDDFMLARSLCPERAEAQRHAARLLRHRLEQLDLARDLDEEADSCVMPLGAPGVEMSVYRRGPNLAWVRNQVDIQMGQVRRATA